MILADSRQVAIRRSLLPVLSAFFYKNFTHPLTTPTKIWYNFYKGRGCSSAVEHQLPKLRVAGSIPVARLNAIYNPRGNHGKKQTTDQRRNPRR